MSPTKRGHQLVVTLIFRVSSSGALRAAVGPEKFCASVTVRTGFWGGAEAAVAGAVCADQRILQGCVPVDPDPSVVLRACVSVWWWRAQ